MRQMFSITRKELDGYFSSPMALIFVGVFLALTLFTFFWIDGFWARGTADVRPLFRSMPLLMIFLVSALTMRQWSEEQQSGTLEILLTMPLRITQMVIGKFIAVLALVIVALGLTIFLPLTISTLGNLDFGPVIGGYLATILLASAYTAIGLFVSSRTDNQLVALILTALVCAALHLIGTSTITELFPSSIAELLRNLSTSGRFASIERGVVDPRDLLYYLSLTFTFLTLNILSLDSKRWSRGTQLAAYRLNSRLTVALIALNLLMVNIVVYPVNALRLDLTAGQEYSLSDVTRETLQNLQEPLLIRAYLSENTHPYLEPLIPRLRDILEEYRLASNGRLEVEIIDPIDNPELETEANQTYGIRPTPVQTVDRSGNALLNIYFDILIRYGDQTEILGFGDLIEVQQFGDGDLDVRLRNPEYDLTSRIRRVVSGFQSIDSVLAALDQPARLTAYVTSETLPEILAEVPQTIETVAQAIADQSDGKFTYEIVEVNQAGISPQFLFDTYQIQPIATSFFSTDSYYLHMVMQVGNEVQVIFPAGELSETEIRTAIESALKRASTGFLQIIGLWTPPDTPQQNAFGQQQQSLSQYGTVQQVLSENYEIRPVDLSTGQVPADINVLLVIAPQNMTEFERFAIDQYLMRGGSLMVAAGNYKIGLDQFGGGLILEPLENGLRDILEHYGISVQQTLVLDTQNEPFPVQVQRDLGGFIVNEIQALNYPHFIDVRADGMDRSSSILSGLPAVTINWASPVILAETLDEDIATSVLLQSSPSSWTTTNTNIQPDQTAFPQTGFPISGEQQRYPLAVTLIGSFSSFYTDNPAPYEALADLPTGDETSTDQEAISQLAAIGTIEQSPATSRIMVIGSAEFLNDNIFQLSSSISGERYLNTLQFVQNSIDWFVEDTELSTIRARGTAVRLLDPLTETEQSTWEAINYGLALLSVIAIGVIWRLRKRSEQPLELLSREELQAAG